MDISGDGKKIVTAGLDRKTRVWTIETGLKITEVEHDQYVKSVAFSPDGDFFVTALDNGTAEMWTTDQAQSLGLVKMRHSGPITDVDLSPDGRHILTTSHDDSARLWPVKALMEEAFMARELVTHTNYRVCRESLRAVPVVPVPPPEMVWAPESLCQLERP